MPIPQPVSRNDNTSASVHGVNIEMMGSPEYSFGKLLLKIGNKSNYVRSFEGKSYTTDIFDLIRVDD